MTRDARGRFVKSAAAEEFAKAYIATYIDQPARNWLGLEPSGLDTKEKWDATDYPVPCGSPTRVMDRLTVSDESVRIVTESLIGANTLYEDILVAHPPRRPWWRRLGGWLRGGR